MSVGLLGSIITSGAIAGQATVVLGSKDFTPDGTGWGTAHPSTIFNGGDPSGLVTDIHWRRWGSPVAIGVGRTSAPKPSGGYYAKQVRIKLRATDIGSCGGRRAYTDLTVRVAGHPGGPLGAWGPWASTSICGSASRPQLNSNCSRITGGAWGRDAHYTVLSSVNLSCRHAMELLLKHDPSPAEALFEEGGHEVKIGGYRCMTYDFDPRTYPPTYTHGSGRARCAKGSKTFKFLYAA